MTTSASNNQLTCEEVNRRLKALGFESGPDEKLSHCAREAIRRGHISLKGEDKKELDQVIFTDQFPDYQCGHKGIIGTVRKATKAKLDGFIADLAATSTTYFPKP